MINPYLYLLMSLLPLTLSSCVLNHGQHSDQQENDSLATQEQAVEDTPIAQRSSNSHYNVGKPGAWQTW